jgi:RNA polymerase sigma-70 factor (ECF subfamily)
VLSPFQKEKSASPFAAAKKSSLPRRVNRYSFWFRNRGNAVWAPPRSSIRRRLSLSSQDFPWGEGKAAPKETSRIVFSQTFSRLIGQKIEHFLAVTPTPLHKGEIFPANPPLSDVEAADIIRVVQQSVQDLNLDDVVVKYRPVVSFKVKKSLGAQTPDWEDVVNEIITQVIEKVKKGEFRGESSIGTFIYTITSRRIVDFIRQKTKVLKGIPEPVPLPDPCDDAESRERARLLAEAIRQLKPKFKEVLDLYYYQELSRDEVAQKLGISPRRVSERLNYAQKLLRKLVKT